MKCNPLQSQDDKIAELKRQLAAAQPAYAMAGAEAGGGGGGPTLEQLFAGLGSGTMLPASPVSLFCSAVCSMLLSC